MTDVWGSRWSGSIYFSDFSNFKNFSDHSGQPAFKPLFLMFLQEGGQLELSRRVSSGSIYFSDLSTSQTFQTISASFA
jgi:hypothetical protein